jgi:hypothetical protein
MMDSGMPSSKETQYRGKRDLCRSKRDLLKMEEFGGLMMVSCMPVLVGLFCSFIGLFRLNIRSHLTMVAGMPVLVGLFSLYIRSLLTLWRKSGLTLCEEVRWISFHSYFDFGYLVKVLVYIYIYI